jgi:hypothetical protein
VAAENENDNVQIAPATKRAKAELDGGIKSTSAMSCYVRTLISLEYEIVAMGRRSMNVDVAVMSRYRLYLGYLRYSL